MCSRLRVLQHSRSHETVSLSALCVSEVFAASALLVTARGHNGEYTLRFSQTCELIEWKETKENTLKLLFFQIVEQLMLEYG
jgi:hypothetical protein